MINKYKEVLNQINDLNTILEKYSDDMVQVVVHIKDNYFTWHFSPMDEYTCWGENMEIHDIDKHNMDMIINYLEHYLLDEASYWLSEYRKGMIQEKINRIVEVYKEI